MTKSHSRFTPLFGERHQSVLWAVDVRAQEGQGSDPTLLDLPTGQVVYGITVNAPLQWVVGETAMTVAEGSVLVVNTRTSPGSVRLSADSDCLVVGMRQTALSGLFEPFRPGLVPGLRELVFGLAGPIQIRAKNEAWDQVVAGFRRPAVSGAARAFWFESQFKALLALLSFNPSPGEGEFFCSRQKRLARVRVARAKSKLEARIDESFDLHRLAAEVGSDASYLSRTFSATTGMTLSQYLRKRRIEKAAEMLVTGRYNVSEVAVEVGYHSLSHFSKAFQQEKGCLPSRTRRRDEARGDHFAGGSPKRCQSGASEGSSRRFVFRKTTTKDGMESRAPGRERGKGAIMTFSNFDSRTKGKRPLPEDRFQLLRNLEEQVRRDRLARKQAKMARPVKAA